MGMLVAVFGPPASRAAAPPRAYQGRVVELLTERPIEGALVVVGWQADHPREGRVLYALREVLTDGNGAFGVEAGTIEGMAPEGALRPGLLAYKPGYVPVPREARAEFGIPVAWLEPRSGVIALKPVRDLDERVEAFNAFVGQTNGLTGNLGGGTLDEIQRFVREELRYLAEQLGARPQGLPRPSPPGKGQP
jgi:hypothetical protein